MNDQQRQFVRANPQMSNLEIGKALGLPRSTVSSYVLRNCRRTPEQNAANHARANRQTGERSRQLTGAKNPRWRGGISKNFYHYKKIQNERYPDRVAARVAVAHAVRAGKLERLPCEACGTPKSFAHHDDYTKPLGVRWLCRPCHLKEHGGIWNSTHRKAA
jgi:ribosomal protein S27AE